MQKVQRLNTIRLRCLLACIYFLLLPLTIAVNSSGASFLKLAAIPIGGYFLVWMLTSGQRLRINVVHLRLFVYTIDLFTSMLIKPSPQMAVVLFGYVLNAGLFFCLSAVDYNEWEMRLFYTAQVLLLIVLVGITLWQGDTYADRTTFTLFGQTSDPNYFVGFFIFPLAVTIERVFHSKYRLWYVLLACLAIYTILLSGSRGGLLALVALLFSCVTLYPKGGFRKLLLVVVLIGAMAVFWLAVRPFLPENILARFSLQAVMETRGTYRLDIWKSMLQEIGEFPRAFLTGRGLDSQHGIFMAGKLEFVVAHNHYIQTLYDQGFIGFILFLSLVGACMVRCFKRRPCVTAAMIAMLVLGISLSFNASTKALWNLIVYAAFAFPEQSGEDASEGA